MFKQNDGSSSIITLRSLLIVVMIDKKDILES